MSDYESKCQVYLKTEENFRDKVGYTSYAPILGAFIHLIPSKLVFKSSTRITCNFSPNALRSLIGLPLPFQYYKNNSLCHYFWCHFLK